MKRGFTLVEVTVALVLTGIVALLAYGSARTGIDTGARIAAYRATTESEALLRSILGDALRHATDGGGNEASFEITSDAASGTSDRIVFFSRGITPPLGAGELWRVTLAQARDGLLLSARPDDPTLTPVDAFVNSVHAVSARAMDDEGLWRDRWEGRKPRAVEIVLLGKSGAAAGPPILVQIGGVAR